MRKLLQLHHRHKKRLRCSFTVGAYSTAAYGDRLHIWSWTDSHTLQGELVLAETEHLVPAQNCFQRPGTFVFSFSASAELKRRALSAPGSRWIIRLTANVCTQICVSSPFGKMGRTSVFACADNFCSFC